MRRPVYRALANIGQYVPVTRVLTSWVAAMVLLPGSAVAQQAVFVDGIRLLHAAMLAVPADAARVTAAIDRMEAGLAGWDLPAASSPGQALLGDHGAEVPMLPLAAYADGFARVIKGDYRGAIAALRRAATQSVDERMRLVEAAGLASQDRHAEAERALRSIVAAHPESALARWWLGRVYENLNQASEARREYEAALPLALSGRGPLYAAIGRLARVEGDFAGAAAALTRRVELVPNDAGAHKDLAFVLREQDRLDEALAELEQALKINPADAEAHADAGRLHLLAGRAADAVTALARAVELMPTRHDPRYALAMALKQVGRTDEAALQLRLFERAQRADVDERRRELSEAIEREDAKRREIGR